MGKEKAKCSQCGQLMVEYKFGFNKGHARALYKIARISETDWVEISKSGMTNSEYANYPKIFYWDLLERKPGVEKGGVCRLTEVGRDFLYNKLSIPKYVFTRLGEVTGYKKPEVWFRTVTGGYDYRPDYQEQARDQLRGQ